uniref:Uncharacterized protein n=1 Tax=Cacopsylla melanoneura TaxID=428564 RepID=A0A8D8Z7F1_9HEMI
MPLLQFFTYSVSLLTSSLRGTISTAGCRTPVGWFFLFQFSSLSCVVRFCSWVVTVTRECFLPFGWFWFFPILILVLCCLCFARGSRVFLARAMPRVSCSAVN